LPPPITSASCSTFAIRALVDEQHVVATAVPSSRPLGINMSLLSQGIECFTAV
jgi:hypothetical protein